jgi:hypothetical protein
MACALGMGPLITGGCFENGWANQPPEGEF